MRLARYAGSKVAQAAFYRTIGENIRRERKWLSVRPEDLGEAIGVSRPSIINMEFGRHRFKMHQIYDIAQFLHIPVARLLIQDNPPKTNSRSEVVKLKAKLNRIKSAVAEVNKAMDNKGEL